MRSPTTHQSSSLSSLSIVVSMFLLLLSITATAAADIDCGCPKTCTPEALNERNNDAPWSCKTRIEWIMKHHLEPEANACKHASSSSSSNNPDTDDHSKPCRAEACDPEHCGSKFKIDPEATAPMTCGCPDTCTPEVLNEQREGMAFTCIARIEHYRHFSKRSRYDSCKGPAEEGYCDYDACHPEACNSTLSADVSGIQEELKPIYVDGYNEDGTKIKSGHVVFWSFLIGIGMGLGFVYKAYQRKTFTRQFRESPENDGVFKDNLHSAEDGHGNGDDNEDDDGKNNKGLRGELELSSHSRPYPYRDSGPPLRVPPRELWESVRHMEEASEEQVVAMG